MHIEIGNKYRIAKNFGGMYLVEKNIGGLSTTTIEN